MVNCACVVSYCMSGLIVRTGATAMDDDEDGWTVVKRHRQLDFSRIRTCISNRKSQLNSV